MPLYDYLCEECEHPFEMLVGSNEEVVPCPRCHSTKVERLLSLPARPLSDTSAQPACNSTGPPCGPVCRRWPGS